MLIQSHLFLSSKIKDTVNSKMDSNLKGSVFSFGSILPDIHPDKRNLPHEFNASFPYLMDKIEEFNEVARSDYELASKDLGIITHFLADYFCLAHNNKNMSIWKHLAYENRLHKALTSWDIKQNESSRIPLGDLEDWIKEKHELYLVSNPSIVTDVLFIQEVCMSISNSLITATVDNDYSTKAYDFIDMGFQKV